MLKQTRTAAAAQVTERNKPPGYCCLFFFAPLSHPQYAFRAQNMRCRGLPTVTKHKTLTHHASNTTFWRCHPPPRNNNRQRRGLLFLWRHPQECCCCVGTFFVFLELSPLRFEVHPISRNATPPPLNSSSSAVYFGSPAAAACFFLFCRVNKKASLLTAYIGKDRTRRVATPSIV